MAVQQHELRYRWAYCGEGQRSPVAAISSGEGVHTAWDEECRGHRQGQARGYGCDRLRAVCARTAAAGAEGRERLAVCGGRIGDACRGPGEVGYFNNQSKPVEAVVIPGVWNRGPSQEWAGNRLRFRCRCG